MTIKADVTTSPRESGANAPPNARTHRQEDALKTVRGLLVFPVGEDDTRDQEMRDAWQSLDK